MKIATCKTGKYLPIVRITGSYQVTIPSEIRKALGIDVGDYIEVTLNPKGGAFFKPVDIIPKKKTQRKDNEEVGWKQVGEKDFLEQYDEKDSAYDHIKL